MSSPSQELSPSKHSALVEDTITDNGSKKEVKNNLNIMAYDVERHVLASLFAMRAMLCGWKRWSVGRSAYHAGDTLKRIHAWYKDTLHPITIQMTDDHKPPRFARHGIRKCLALVPDSNLHGLHISLLTTATLEVIKGVDKSGVGSQCHDKLKRWLAILMKTKESNLFHYAPSTIKQHFVEGCQSFDKLISDPIITPHEHPGFNAEALFIQIAHMVLFYSTSPVYNTLPCKSKHLTVSKAAMTEWERHSGRLMEIVFNLNRHGMITSFDNRLYPPTIANVKLPYSYLAREVHVEQVFSISSVHDELMGSFIQWSDSIAKHYPVCHWEVESKKLLTYFGQVQTMNEEYDWKCGISAKVRKNWRKNHPGSRTKHPKQFPRDMFLMGMYSYHQDFTRTTSVKRNKPSRTRFTIGHLKG